MLVFPSMLLGACDLERIPRPDREDLDDIELSEIAEDFPHFYVFCSVQLCRPLSYWGEHWENAKVISSIPDDKIREITLEELLDMGLAYSQI